MSGYSHDVAQAMARGHRNHAVNLIRSAFIAERAAAGVYNQKLSPGVDAAQVLGSFFKACALEGVTAEQVRTWMRRELARTDSGQIEKVMERAQASVT